MQSTQRKPANLFLFFAFILTVALGLVCNYFYQESPKHSINIEHFQKELLKNETQGTKTLNSIK